MAPWRDPGWGFVRLLAWVWVGAAALLTFLSGWVYDVFPTLVTGGAFALAGVLYATQPPDSSWWAWLRKKEPGDG